MRPFSAEIRSGDEAHKVRTLQISISNGRYYGGGMAVEEEAAIDDGCLNLYSWSSTAYGSSHLFIRRSAEADTVCGRKFEP